MSVYINTTNKHFHIFIIAAFLMNTALLQILWKFFMQEVKLTKFLFVI